MAAQIGFVSLREQRVSHSDRGNDFLSIDNFALEN